jgi:hypothetical protein
VPSYAGEQERVVQGPQPRWFSLGKDLQSKGMAGLPEYFDQPDGSADKKNGKSNVNHRH